MKERRLPSSSFRLPPSSFLLGGAMDTYAEVCDLFERRGDEAYFGEPVSQKEHALQCALEAEREDAPDALVVAALLHDIGHLVHGLGEDIADRGFDARHENLGAEWLARRFGPE